VAAEIRAFNLVSEKALDDRAVEELARSVAFAAVLGGEALGALTRRESELSFGDLLEPIETETARSRPGIRFSVALADDPEMILGVLFASTTSAVALADVFFGGPGEGGERRLTDIEARAISTSIAGIIAPVLGVLSGREKCQAVLTYVKDAPLPAADLVELSMKLTVGEVSVEAALFAPNPDVMTGDYSARDQMAQTVKNMHVPVDIDLASVQMAAGDVQALADGDVIVFDAAPDDEAVARSGERDLLRGRIGESSGRRFLEVTEVLVGT
jgi:hypothetical protein